MNKPVLHRIWKGFGANLYGQAVTVVIQLVGVPILLHAWGARLYGEWLILFAIPAYLSMTDLGFSQSAANDMTQQVARGDQRAALAVFQSLAALIFSVVIVGLMLTSAALLSLPIERWIHFSAMSAGEIRWVLWLLAAEVLVRLFSGVNHAGFRSNGEYALHAAIYSSTSLTQYAGAWTAALMGFGPVAAATSFLIVRLIVTPAETVLLVVRHPWLKVGFAHARNSELRRLAKPALANVSMPLAQALNIQGMVLLVGAMLGPLAVVAFSTLRTLTRLIVSTVQAVANAIEPELAVGYGAADRPLMRRLFVNGLRVSFWLALACAIGLELFGGFILDAWTGGKIAMDASLFHWLLVSAMASVLWYGALATLKAANRHLRAAALYGLSSAATVVLAGALLALDRRLSNAGLALLLMDVAMAAYTLRAASSMIGARVSACLADAANPFPAVKFLVRRSYVR